MKFAFVTVASPVIEAKRRKIMPYNRKKLGIVISRLRIDRGVSQETLSALSGIARSHLAMIELGKKVPRTDTIWSIAEALNIKLSDLISLIENEP